MAYKTFVVERTEDESTQTAGPATLSRADVPPLVKVFDDESDIVLSTLSTNEIVATKNTDYSAVAVVDRVADGNLNPVTSNAVANALSYSTDETPTGGKWIDGKPIYRKVWTGTYNAGRYTDILPEGLIMISITGYIKYSQDSGTRYWVINAPQNSSNNVYFASVWYNSAGFVQFEVQGPFAGNDSVIIFEYTKTTD